MSSAIHHVHVITNFLKRFEHAILSKEDHDTTVRDTLWNIDQIMKEK